jgi:hypothetical protein
MRQPLPGRKWQFLEPLNNPPAPFAYSAVCFLRKCTAPIPIVTTNSKAPQPEKAGTEPAGPVGVSVGVEVGPPWA